MRASGPGARRLVGAAAGDGRVHRTLPRPPRGDHAAGRSLAGRARGGSPCRRAVRGDAGTPPPGSRGTASRSCSGCRATSRGPRARTVRRAASDGSRSPGWPSSVSRRAAPTPPCLRSRAPRRPPRGRSTGPGCSPPSSRSCWRRGPRGARRACSELEEIAARIRERDARCRRRARSRLGALAAGDHARRSAVAHRASDRGSGSVPRTRSRGRALSSATPAGAR